MSKQLTQRELTLVCVVSALLTTQTSARAQTAPDSLGLRAFNAAAHVIPGEISINTNLKKLLLQAPELRATTLGVMHAAWETPLRADRLRTTFVYRADSNDLFDRRFSSKSFLAAFESYFYGDDVRIALAVLPAVRGAADALGPPEFCDRDTGVREAVSAIDIISMAEWRRGNVRIQISGGMNLRDVLPQNRSFARRFGLSYRLFLATDRLMQRDAPTRHDTPCFITDEELREHAAPLDSAAYDSVRAVLMKRPQKVDRR